MPLLIFLLHFSHLLSRSELPPADVAHACPVLQDSRDVSSWSRARSCRRRLPRACRRLRWRHLLARPALKVPPRAPPPPPLLLLHLLWGGHRRYRTTLLPQPIRQEVQIHLDEQEGETESDTEEGQDRRRFAGDKKGRCEER
eukprot:748231-Hanusia_phi.AAC.1